MRFLKTNLFAGIRANTEGQYPSQTIPSGTWWRVVVAFCVMLAVSLVLVLCRFGGNVTGFFVVGNVFPASSLMHGEAFRAQEHKVGYDGQFFLALGLDPFLVNEQTETVFDNPQYRYRRIGYPLLGYVAGGGHAVLIPYAMVLINCLCVAALVFFAECFRSLRSTQGRTTSDGLWMLCVPGVWTALVRSTADLLGATLLFAALYMLCTRRPVRAATALAAACLTREPYLATVAVLGVFALCAGRFRVAVAVLSAAVPALCWIAHIPLRVASGHSAAKMVFTHPFAGTVAKFADMSAFGTNKFALVEDFTFLVFFAVICMLAITVAARWKEWTYTDVAVAPLLAIYGISGMAILCHYAGFLRIFVDAWLLLAVIPFGAVAARGRSALMCASGVVSCIVVYCLAG